MIKKIYKYKLEAVPRQTIKLPVLAQPLNIGLQAVTECGGLWETFNIVLWALVNPDPEVPQHDVRVRMIMTGEEIDDPERLDYIGTIELHPTGYLGHGLVAHFFIENDR